MRCRVYSVLEALSGQFFWYREDRVDRRPLILTSPLSLLTVTQHSQPANNTATMTQSRVDQAINSRN